MLTENTFTMTSAMSQSLHTSPLRLVAVNTILLSGSMFLTKLMVAGISITMARKLGPEVFGAYETALGLTYALVLYVNLGMNGAIVRSASDSHQDTNSFLGTALLLKMGLAVLIYPLAILIVRIFGYAPLIVQLVGIMSIFSAITVFELTLSTVFQARQRIVWLAVTRVLSVAVYACVALTILYSTMSIWQLAWARSAGALIAVACLWIFIKKFRFAQPRFRLHFVRPLLLSSFPFALAQMITTWRLKIDILLVTALTDECQAGIFSASGRVLGLLLLLPVAFSYALTPAAFETGRKTMQALAQLYRRSVFISMIIGIPIAAGMFFIAEPFMEFVFGAEYAPRLLPLMPLSWCLPCILLSIIAMNTLWGAGRMYTVPLFFGMGMMVNVAVDLLLIPNYGAWGAALGVLIGQLVTVIAALILVRFTLFRIGIVSLLWVPILSSAVMMAALYVFRGLLHSLPGLFLIDVALGAAIYMLVLLSLGKVTGLSKKSFWPRVKQLK